MNSPLEEYPTFGSGEVEEFYPPRLLITKATPQEGNFNLLFFAVKFFMDVEKLFIRDVGINLSGSNVGVTEHHLNRADIGAIGKQVSGKTVADDVRSDFFGDAGLDGILFYNSFDGSAS